MAWCGVGCFCPRDATWALKATDWGRFPRCLGTLIILFDYGIGQGVFNNCQALSPDYAAPHHQNLLHLVPCRGIVTSSEKRCFSVASVGLTAISPKEL
jgi:hypothetical protein